MKKPTARSLILSLAMLGAVALADHLRPTEMLTEGQDVPDLNALVPARFGNWSVDDRIVPISVTPDVQAKLDILYSQLVNRTYVDKSGRQIMLSIAYGRNQSGDASQVHRPEFCYGAQGFQIEQSHEASLETRYGAFPVRRLVARAPGRTEPITYWVTVGEDIALPGLTRKLAQLKYGLTGVVPDGLLLRVSSISTDPVTSYREHEQFVSELLDASSSELLKKLIGRLVL